MGNLGQRTVTVALVALTAVAAVVAVVVAYAVTSQEISSDPYTNASSQHQTEVEADTFAAGGSVVAAFQAGRFYSGGGSSNIGWATSTDGGASWTSGFLPSLTVFSTPAGPAGRATDPSVAFDSAHGRWLISALTCAPAPDTCGTAPISVVVSRSTDGNAWDAPITIATGAYDKNWTVCDNGPASAFFGRCYTSWTDTGSGLTLTSASTDGGLTWGSPVPASGMVGVQPVVQPNGALVITGATGSSVLAVRSTNGGMSFSGAVVVASVQSHSPAGMRAPVLPSAEVDASGKVYVAWADCRFRAACSANDIVISASTDGVAWPAAPTRVPIDGATSGVDHFIPGLGVDPAKAAATAAIALSYYYFPDASCTVDTCQLNVGFVSSSDGGATWSGPTQLNPQPMALSWLADTSWPGRMVGDYMSTSFVSGRAVPVFAVASAPTGTILHQAMAAAAITLPTPTPLPTPIPTASPTPTPTPCPALPDGDLDGIGDACDNCPATPNAGQENNVHPLTPAGDACENPDGDAWADGIDGCPDVPTPWVVPPDDNPDCDGFPAATQQGARGPESFIGTNPNLACGVNAWPVDINDDLKAGLSDILAYIPVFGSVAPFAPYNARFDLNADGDVGLQDILLFIPFFNLTCTP